MKSEKPKKEPQAPSKSRKPPAKSKADKSSVTLPSILLEGDISPTPQSTGPGQRYALGTTPPPAPSGPTEESQSLPEAYGTERLLLTARDPYWLFAHWDLTREQQQRYNRLSADNHLVLRIYKDQVGGSPASETHVHPESRNWFVNVAQPGTKFVGELGYYQSSGRWVTISTSASTFTPPDRMSDDTSVWFETLPADLEFSHLLDLVRTVVTENVPLIEAIQQLRAAGFQGLPDRRSIVSERWTGDQKQALSEIITRDASRRIWMGSVEITELIRRQFQLEMSSAGLGEFSLPSSWSGGVSSFSSVSSPFGGVERKKGFWFNVNAELIIYGATEPDAKVTIGGRPIKLRPDGTFSYRFSLPDGHYALPAIATSADGDDSRVADLKFQRTTQYRGDVGKHPQDPKLKPPVADHLS